MYSELIAKGIMVDVYKDGNQAVKLFDPNYPKSMVFYEALVQSKIEETGLKVPAIREVGIKDGQWILSMDIIEGKTLAQIMTEEPEKACEYIQKVVDVQLEIHSKTSPVLPKLKDKLVADINSLTLIDDVRKYELLTRLEGMPKHTKLCHGNFDPNNIIINGDNIYIIDWIRASQGNASADVAKTFLLLSLQNADLAKLYMDDFCAKTKTDKKYVQAWLPIVAAAYLKECKPDERDFLLNWTNVVEYE